MLKVNGLTKTFGGQELFDDISFAFSRGERVGLVGKNGHGKTTLFKIILGQEPYDEGEIGVPRHYRIGHLSQHISFTEDTVLKEACLALPGSEDGIDMSYKVEAILMGLGVSQEQFELHPSSLSGGYQIRLNLAKVLASEPDLLLLDEPTNYLDIISVRWLKGFLRNWKGEMMIITHDRDFMDSVSTHTMAIHRRKVRKVAGSTEKLYMQILQDEEVYELTRQNEEKKRKETEKFINRFRASATKASAVQSRVKALAKAGTREKLDEIRSLDFEFNSCPFNGKWLMEVDNLSFGYEPGQLLIDGVSFAVGKKDRIGIIGKNGKGKTTLLSLMAGENTPVGGVIKPHSALRLAYFGQTNIERLNKSHTVEKELMEAHPDYSRGAARRAAGVMMFDGDNALKKIEVLSGGEKSRVLLAKLLLQPANMLLLDEPTNHLDMDSVDSLIEAIDCFDGAVAVVTHSELMLKALVNRLIVFDGGRITLFEGTYDEFLEKVGWESERSEGAQVKPKQKSGNRKESRKLRAEVVAQKSAVLKPIQKRISDAEAAIIRMEADIERLGRELLAATETDEAQTIAAISKAYHGTKEKSDTLFDELETLTGEQERIVREYEARLKELD